MITDGWQRERFKGNGITYKNEINRIEGVIHTYKHCYGFRKLEPYGSCSTYRHLFGSGLVVGKVEGQLRDQQVLFSH